MLSLVRSDLTEATLAGASISLIAAVTIVVLLTAVSLSKIKVEATPLPAIRRKYRAHNVSGRGYHEGLGTCRS